MAGHDHFLIRLCATLRTLDDDALASLANKGLLRRARKDLEAERPALLNVEAGAIRVRLPDATVEVPEAPTRARCDCPASGVCRHVLAALVFLRDDPEVERLATERAGLATNETPGASSVESEDAASDAARNASSEQGGAASSPPVPPQSGAPTPPSPAEILGRATDDELRRWAGRATFKKGLAWIAGNPDVRIEATGSLVVRFPARNITCRWIPADGLLDMVCSCQSETACEHVVAAVLAYQIQLGVRAAAVEAPALAESAGAPRTRAEVLASVLTLVGELTSLGLSRLSTSVERRLTTLAVSAHGVDLPRLEGALAALARAVSLAVRRDAQSSSAELLRQCARVAALATALQVRPQASLIGVHRAKYQSVGQLTFHGVGARWWRSSGGQHGVTVYFWNGASGRWATWSDSRPVGTPGFDPQHRFHGEGPWVGCESPREASGSVVRLTGAYLTDGGRLSARAATRAFMLGPTPVGRWRETFPDAFTQWNELVPRVRRLFGGGLAPHPENHDLVALLPVAWGPSVYDPTTQQWRRAVIDEQGRALWLWLPFTPEHAASIEYLERRPLGANCGVFGTLRIVAGQIVVQPISLLTDERIVSLNLDDEVLGRAGARAGASSPASSPASSSPTPQAATSDVEPTDEMLEEEDERERPVGLATASSSALARLLTSALGELEVLAEGGLMSARGGANGVERLAELARRFGTLGLTTCAAALRELHARLERRAALSEAAAQQAAAQALLRASYVLSLAIDQELLEELVAGYV